MNYELMQGIEGGTGGCLCCGYQHAILPMTAIIAVGFGSATLEKNNELIYSEPQYSEEYMSVEEAEQIAIKETDNDWRIHLIAPLSERHYQRQGNNHWVLYEKGQGFA